MDKTEYKLIQSTKRRLESQGNREYIYMFYQFENVLVMTNENGAMYLAGRKHS